MIQKLRLGDFRNFESKVIEFDAGTTVIVGPNASGKTNILESVFLLSTGKSFKAKIEEEMINYDEQIARVKAKTHMDTLEVVLTRGEIGYGTRLERVPRKKLIVNGVSKRLIDFAARLRVTLFGPWDLDLVTESPSVRRKFLDTALSQVDYEYRRNLLSYEKGLRARNKLLYRIREEGIPRAQLIFWNSLLIKNGNYLSQKREEFIGFVNETPGLNDQRFSLFYDKSAISDSRLEQYANEEVAAASTLVGPHRDDFIFRMKERDLARYGSRGEQRMGVLWLKLAELAYIEKETGERPTLLLDDIFSELDHDHRSVVMKTATEQQTIITTADQHFVVDFKGLKQLKL